MTASTQTAGPKTVPRSQAILKRARHTDTFRELAPGTAALGWPAVKLVRGQVFLSVPLFDQQRRPDGAVNLYPPFATLTLGWAPPLIAAYLDLATEGAWTADISAPAGTFPHPELGDSEHGYLTMRRQLFTCYDAVCAALSDGREPSYDTAAELSRLLRVLLEPALEPYYRALEPDFFGRYLSSPAPPPRPEREPVVASDSVPALRARSQAAQQRPFPMRIDRRVFEELGALVRDARELVELSGSESLVAQLDAIDARRMRTRGVVTLVGRRKSGRSTIANILLGTSVLPSRTTASTAAPVRIVPGALTRLTAGDRAYREQELDDAWPALQSPDGSPTAVQEAVLELDNRWLRDIEAEIIDVPGIDTPGGEAAQRYALQADFAIMTVAALNPLDLGERAFLELAGDHQVPVLVVITQLDRVEDDERASLVDEIRSRARALDAVAGVLAPAGLAGRPTALELRDAIDPWLVDNQRMQQRIRHSLAALRLLSLELIRSSEELTEISRLDADERQREARSARLGLDAMRRDWDRLSLQVERLQVEYIQSADNWFDQEENKLRDRLSFDLAHQSNPKTWWEQDLPYVLRRELTGMANLAERSLQAKLATDLERLSSQLPGLVGSESRLTPAAVGTSSSLGPPRIDDLELANIELIRPFAAGGGLLGGLAGAAVAIPGAFPISLILASLSGEFVRKQAATRQRGEIAGELGHVLSDLVAHLRRAFGDEVRAVYGDALGQLRDRREAWLQDRLRALEETGNDTAPPDGERLRDGAEMLARKVASMLGEERAS